MVKFEIGETAKDGVKMISISPSKEGEKFPFDDEEDFRKVATEVAGKIRDALSSSKEDEKSEKEAVKQMFGDSIGEVEADALVIALLGALEFLLAADASGKYSVPENGPVSVDTLLGMMKKVYEKSVEALGECCKGPDPLSTIMSQSSYILNEAVKGNEKALDLAAEVAVLAVFTLTSVATIEES